MGSLRDFEAHKDFYTEWSFLISETPSSHGPQLYERLPASLVWLKIHDSKGCRECQYEKVIKSVQYARERNPQKLKWLIFGGTRVKLSLDIVDLIRGRRARTWQLL